MCADFLPLALEHVPSRRSGIRVARVANVLATNRNDHAWLSFMRQTNDVQATRHSDKVDERMK